MNVKDVVTTAVPLTTGLIAGMGSEIIMDTAISKVMDSESEAMTTATKFMVGVGSIGIGLAVANSVSDAIVDTFDALKDCFHSIRAVWRDIWAASTPERKEY